MKIVQFCTPAPNQIIALTDKGDLWERVRDERYFPGPGQLPRYNWRKIEGPAAEIEKVAGPAEH